MKRVTTVQILLVFLVFRLSALTFSPSSWDLGSIEYNSGIQILSVEVNNNTETDIDINFVSTCNCLVSDTEKLTLAPEETVTVNFSFDPVDENGLVSKFIIIRTNQKGLEKALFQVTGSVSGYDKSESDIDQNSDISSASDSSSSPEKYKTVKIKYFYSPGCRSCRHFLENEIPEIERKTGSKIEIEKLDILDPKIYEEYISVLSDSERETIIFPSLLIDNKIFQGDKEISQNIEQAIYNYRETEETDKRKYNSAAVVLSLTPVFLAGLLDGINPCVFSTLLFLISTLTLAGKEKKEILSIGIFFTAAVFVTYFFVGLGLFQGLRSASVFPLIADLIKWILIIFLLLISILSFNDYIKIKGGKVSGISLQLPKFLKLKIHGVIREQTKSSSIIIGSLILGVMVSIFELACTGQVYFPTIAYLVKLGEHRAYFYLLVYNISFILPLFVVFILIYKGTGSKPITVFFQNNMGFMKVSLSILFLILAGVVFWI